MFESAAFKLTLYYLGIIMALSVGFSMVVFRLSTAEIDRGLRRPPYAQQRIEPGGTAANDFEQFRQARLDESSDNIRNRLVLFNVLTLVGGGLISYGLARRTLHPIEEALEAQTRFTADASHELRTPLTVMQTEIEVALRNKKLTSQQAKGLLQSNLEEVERLRNLSDGLLQLARQDTPIDMSQVVPLAEVTQAAVKRTHKLAAAKSITIQNKVGLLSAYGDSEAITQVFTILLDNAIKYSDKNTFITIKAKQQPQYVAVSVADQGRGITEADKPHIFNRFYRADISRTRSGESGYGLGLSIAQKIVGLHHGTIVVKSAPTKGSTFTVKFPVHASRRP